MRGGSILSCYPYNPHEHTWLSKNVEVKRRQTNIFDMLGFFPNHLGCLGAATRGEGGEEGVPSNTISATFPNRPDPLSFF